MAGKGKPKRAWIIKFQDIGREDDFVVYFDKEEARREFAAALADFAQEELEGIDWEEGPPESLTDTIEAFKQGDYSGAVSSWEDYETWHGPVDRTATLIESTVQG